MSFSMQRTSAHVRYGTRRLDPVVLTDEKKAPENEPEVIGDVEEKKSDQPAGTVPTVGPAVNRYTQGPGVGPHNMSAMNRAFFSDYR